MENYKCSICSEISESSVTCLDCEKIICKKHFNSDNYCPCCRKFPFKYKENTKLTILDTNCIYICNICGFKGDKNTFWTHLTENHKEEIISKFKLNDDTSIENKDNNQEYKRIDENNCEHKNKDIKCECCPDHICKKGNCLCVKCMRDNLFKLKLVNGELINRAGRIAKFIKGHYYCGCQYESIDENCKKRKIKKCEYSEPCNDCKVLTKFRNIYFG